MSTHIPPAVPSPGRRVGRAACAEGDCRRSVPRSSGQRHIFARLLIALAVVGIVAAACAPAGRADDSEPSTHATTTRVALKWSHQAQFAGVYVADRLGFFSDHGVHVTATPGGTHTNPLVEVANGRADIAIASMSQAVDVSTAERRFVNVAQIFRTSPAGLICRIGPNLLTAGDIRTATVASPDQAMVAKVLAAMFPDGHRVVFSTAAPDVTSLKDGRVDCIWGFTFNEYWKAIEAGVGVVFVDPADYDVASVEDGVYVEESRLADDEFRSQLIGFLLGLREGWNFASGNQSAAIAITIDVNPILDAEDQRRQLEAVLPLIGEPFGFLDLGAYERTTRIGSPVLPPLLEERLWTHSVFNEVQARLGVASPITPVTRHYLGLLQSTLWYQVLVAVGIGGAAFSAAILGLALNYRFWGRLILALLTALGGGLLRDIILGHERFPSYLVAKPLHLYVVLGVTSLVTITRYVTPSSLDTLRRIAQPANAVGFGIISANGAVIAVVAEASVFWAPAMAAVSIAGGGIMADVLIRREHDRFRGEIYEEVAAIGGLILLGALWAASHVEHQPSLILGSVVGTVVLLTSARIWMQEFGLRYPSPRDGARTHDVNVRSQPEARG